jgi:hypothetical protein
MRRYVALASVAVFSLGLVAGVSAATAPKKAGHSLTGTIESFDGTAKTLTVKTTKASTVFKLGDAVKVWSGSKSVALDQLGSSVGSKVTVKFTGSGDDKTATSVHVTQATKTAGK